jgi:hypothetical protein
MGLLDSLLYNQNSYGGQGGGLLDMLQNSLMQQNSYQPSAGFPQQQPGSGRSFDNATFDPTTYAPSQPTNSIAVGGYQMPRIGSPDQFVPQQAMTPPNAQPAQGQLPQQAPAEAPPQQLPPALGGGGSGFNLGNLGRAFNPDGLIARLTGNDSRSIAQQNLKAQYDSLVPILGPQKAMLAVMNPEAGKTLLNEALTSKEKYQVISEDPLQGKQYGFVNDRDQTVNGKPINAQPATATSGSMAAVQQAQQAGVSGEALYDHLPAQMRGTVKAMIEGRQPLPSTAAMRSPATLALIDAAHAIDPTFDATSWAARQAGAKDFTSGKSAEMVRAANQTLAHVGSLLDAMDNLKNGKVPALNALGNTINEQVWGTGEQGAFRTNAHAVAEEMSKVFKGANLSDAEIRHWEQNLSENMSPAQQKAQIAKLSELLHGSLAALEEKRVSAIGPMAAAKAGPVIKDEGQKVLERIDNWVKSNGAPAAPAKSALPSGWSVQVR